MEEWKAVKGYEGFYEVSSLGRVRSLPRRSTSGRVLKQYVSSHNGYCYVNLSKHNKSGSARVHCLVMAAFDPVDKKPGFDPEHTINHIDGDKTNNRLENLEWCTQSENQKHAYRTGLELPPSGVPVIDLDTSQIYDSYATAARSIGGSRGNMIQRVCDGKRSHYRGHHFARLEYYKNNSIPSYEGKHRKGVSASLWR